MKSASNYRPAIALLFVFFLAFPVTGRSQDSDLPPAFTREQLAQMLAPIALYPDTLLSHVLMASTYPIEVVEADRWVRKNPGLKDESLDAALLAKDWAPSVKTLCHFPTVLALMSERIGETTNIGNAFLAQEEDVMAMVQELRARAYEQGNLESTSKQKVIVEKQTIIIEPADPRIIYVPYYDPLYIYGSWLYPAYPPYYWGPSRVSINAGISYRPGFFVGFAFGTWSYFDWPHRSIYINVHKRPRYVRHDRWIVKSGRWLHVPHHRRGVAYRDKSTARKYGQYPTRLRVFNRYIRGFPDRGDLERIRIDQAGQKKERSDRDRQARERVEQERQSRQRAERERQTRQRTEQAGQPRPRAERERRMRERVERNIFNRIDEGGRERQSSARGRRSREGRRVDDAGGRGRGDRERSGGGGWDDRGRMRR